MALFFMLRVAQYSVLLPLSRIVCAEGLSLQDFFHSFSYRGVRIFRLRAEHLGLFEADADICVSGAAVHFCMGLAEKSLYSHL